MGRGNPSAITLRIRAMARIERLKAKISDAEDRETVRMGKAKERLDNMRAELAALETETS